MSVSLLPPSAVRPASPRQAAFADPAGPDVFGGVVHGAQLWTADPFDVPAVHAEARAAFHTLLARASAPDPPPHGKTLLLLGEAGSGKTHLMRAFRHETHRAGAGYCGYLQMRTRSDNYARYLLSNLLTSLEQPYKPGGPQTGLDRLARGLLDALDMVPEAVHRRLSDDPYLESEDIADLVHRFADLAVQHPKFRGIDVNVLRAVLYCLPSDGRIRPRILNWLRCEELSRYDRDLIGDLVPRPQPEKPMETVLDLGRLMHAVQGAALVLLVDQIDEVLGFDRPGEDPGEQFRAALATLNEVADKLPTAVVVVGCLSDLFVHGEQRLPGWLRDRVTKNPPPLTLSGKLDADQLAAVVGRRLEHLFADLGAAEPLTPFAAADLAPLVGLQARAALEHLQRHRARCIAAGQWLPFAPGGASPRPADPSPPAADWERRWNDFLSSYTAPVLGDEPDLAGLLAFAAAAVSAELPDGVHLAAEPDGRFVPVECQAGDAMDKLLVAVCDKSARGGGLGKQVDEVARRAGELQAVFVRSTDFPGSPTADVSKKLAALVRPRGKGRRVVVSNSDWRALAAFRRFHATHHTDPGFADWQRAERPLAELPAVHTIFALDKLPAARPAVPPSSPPAPPTVQVPAKAAEVVIVAPPAADAIRLGVTRSAVPVPAVLRPADLCRHAAFLGGSGSGKTTAALTVIEHLLLAGVPAVLLDRKGDLAQYADPAAWAAPEPDPERVARRDRLRAAIDVQLYTPGSDAGRPLAIPVVPADLGSLPAAEREQVAQYAAAGLGGMMGYKGRAPDPKLDILQKAIEVLATGPGPVTVRALQKLVADRDDALTAAAEYDDKHFKKLAENLLTLGNFHRRLLDGGDPLDVDALLGRGPAAVPGKTRLTIVNTQFLRDDGVTDFWVAQFLLAVDRWRQKNPAPAGVLQAVFLFDEADKYLPAVRQPASKGPMEGLLKRARSAGIGVFLATQSPGDLDYKCRDQVLTWLVGRVQQPTAVDKLRPLLERRPDASDKLAGQAAGQFYLVREADVAPVTVDRNLLPTAQLPEDRVLAAARAAVPIR